jgi:hypothetical protein
VRNEEVLHRVTDERNTLHTINRRKANWIGHIWRRNCLLKHIIEGKTEEKWNRWEYKEEDVSSYWITPRKREASGN